MIQGEQIADFSALSLRPENGAHGRLTEAECGICMLKFKELELLVCQHSFCPDCWEQ